MAVRQAGQDGWMNAVAHEVGPGVTISPIQGGYVVNLPCTVCHQTKEYQIPKRFPPVVIRKNLEQKGWRTGKHLTCTHCVATRPKANVRSKISDSLPIVNLPTPAAPPPARVVAVAGAQPVDTLAALNSLLQPAAPTPKPEPAPVSAKQEAPSMSPEKVAPKAEPPAKPSMAAAKAHRKMMTLLEDYYDEKNSRYKTDKKGPYSDQRIADESGASLEHVRAERDRWFGPLREPVEFETLQLKMLELEALVSRTRTEADAAVAHLTEEFNRRAQDVAQRAETAVGELQKQMKSLSEELTKTARRNGWL